MKKILLHSLVYLAAYFIFFAIFYFGYDSPSKNAYGFITAWMGVLWVSYIFRMSLLAAIIPFIIVGIFYFVILVFPIDSFYHDAPGEFSFPVLVSCFIAGCFFSLPILINNAIFFLEKKLKALFQANS